jgi:inositol-hexakisphosphate kinase
LDRFICHNKYYGRTLTPEGLKNALKKFLLNDNYSRLNLIPLLLEQLESLYSVIVKLETFRFYTSSLLILYEGMDSHIETNTKAIDIRMIDFAHSTHQFMSIDKTVHKGPDRGYIFGLNNLIKLLKSIESETNQF